MHCFWPWQGEARWRWFRFTMALCATGAANAMVLERALAHGCGRENPAGISLEHTQLHTRARPRVGRPAHIDHTRNTHAHIRTPADLGEGLGVARAIMDSFYILIKKA